MIFYDIMLIGVVVLFDACALWLTVKVFKGHNQMSELEAAIVGFVFITCAITLSFYAAVIVTQSSQSHMKPEYKDEYTYKVPDRPRTKRLRHPHGKLMESPTMTFGDGHHKMWKM